MGREASQLRINDRHQPARCRVIAIAPGLENPGDIHWEGITRNEEAAIVRTLPAGAYTAIVRGVGNTTGVAVVEVYNLQ